MLKVTVLTMLLLVAVSATFPACTVAAQDKSGVSQQDKMKACNNTADRRGLKGDDRKSFMQDCLSKATETQKVSDMSTKDKVNGCKDLADRRNLKGEDRRSFIKNCMEKANSR